MASNTHIWRGQTTGSKGLLLLPGHPFDANEHDYIDIDAAVESGKAEPIVTKVTEPLVKPLTPTPTYVPVPKRKKGRK